MSAIDIWGMVLVSILVIMMCALFWKLAKGLD
jgi:hypothetical protein